ncbi:MAG: hypothetical protein WDW36_005028 [Sanguina aurantia]
MQQTPPKPAPSSTPTRRRTSDKGSVTFSPLLCHPLGPASSQPSRKTLTHDQHHCDVRVAGSPTSPNSQYHPAAGNRYTRTSSGTSPTYLQDRCSSGQVILSPSPDPGGHRHTSSGQVYASPSPGSSDAHRSNSREPEVTGDMLSYALSAAASATSAMYGTAEDQFRQRYRLHSRSSAQSACSPVRAEKQPAYPQAYSVYASADNWASARELSYNEEAGSIQPQHHYHPEHQLHTAHSSPPPPTSSDVGSHFSHRRSSGPAAFSELSAIPVRASPSGPYITSAGSSACLAASNGGEDASNHSSRRSGRSSLTANGGDWSSYRGSNVSMSGRGRSHGGGGATTGGSSPSNLASPATEALDLGYSRRGRHSSNNGAPSVGSSGGHTFLPLAQYLSSRRVSVAGTVSESGRSQGEPSIPAGVVACDGHSPTRAGRSRNNGYAGAQVLASPGSHCSQHSQPAFSVPGTSPPLSYMIGTASGSGMHRHHVSTPNLPALGGSIWSIGAGAAALLLLEARPRSSTFTADRSSACTNDRSSVSTNDRSSVSTNERSSTLSNGDRSSYGSQATLSGGGGGSNRSSLSQRAAPGVVFNPAMGLHEDTVYSWVGASGAHAAVTTGKLQRQFSQRRGEGGAGLRAGSVKTSNDATEGRADSVPALKDWRVDGGGLAMGSLTAAVAAGGVLQSASSASVVEGGVMSVVSTLVQHHSAPPLEKGPCCRKHRLARASAPLLRSLRCMVCKAAGAISRQQQRQSWCSQAQLSARQSRRQHDSRR